MTTVTERPSPAIPGAAEALLELNRRRRRLRRWVLIAAIPIFVILPLFTAKVLSMYGFAHQAITQYLVADYAGSESAARNQEIVNVLELYKAPYNVGVALAGAERLEESRAKFEEALTLARGLEVCAVRTNLSIVIERQGDAALGEGDPAAGSALYAEALTVLADMPDECKSSEASAQSPDSSRDMGETIDESQKRLQQKQQESEQNSSNNTDGEPEQEQPSPNGSQLEDLKDKLTQGEQERQDAGKGGTGGEDPGGSSGTDKPW